MSGITQIVDGRIEQIRKERAELDELRASLERKEAELLSREREYDTGPLTDRKAALLKEIEDATLEIARLRAEKHLSIETFGDEMDSLHAEKTADSEAQAKQLKSEIAFLIKGRSELEEEVAALRKEKDELDEKSNRDRTRIMEEKEAFLTRTRAEREASLKEINLAHSVAIADLDRERKALQDEISAMEQTKTIEWNKIQAEISRYKTSQLAELDTHREQFLAEAEKEKSSVLGALRTEERRQLSEISRQKREFDQEMLKLHAEKQTILDEIKLLEYEYEKAKSENIVKLEKARVDNHKELEAQRTEALAKLEDEQSVLANEWKRQTAELRSKHRDEVAAAEKEIAEYDNKKAGILRDIDQLAAKYEQIRAENDAELEALRGERLKEIDEQRLKKLAEVEEARQERVAALEQSFLEKSTALEAARTEKLDACRQAITAAENEMDALKQQRFTLEQELIALRTEGSKIREENKTQQKTALLERHLELEKQANEKLAEIERVCAGRLSHAEELFKRMTSEVAEAEESLTAQKSAANETMADLRRQISQLESELNRQKEDKLAEIQQDVINAMDEFSKLKLAKLSEIELYLETYKQERLTNIQNDLDRQMRGNYKQLDELNELNEDYNKRMKELQELSLTLEADKRNIYFREQRYQDELAELKKLLASETDSHRREMAVLSEAKEQQISLLQNQLKSLTDE
ncbi:MAG: hypothetical protein FWB91_04240 [Defluviitaleaceae bacterium]|nr:hypothetical protein [Defluviitaleaceae bacterium]